GDGRVGGGGSWEVWCWGGGGVRQVEGGRFVLGLCDPRVRRVMMSGGPENETTPLDLAHGLARLLEEPFADDLLEALRVAADAESFLPHLLPGIIVAAKSGELDTVRHEVALLEQDGRRLVTAGGSATRAPPPGAAAAAARR